ncbi:MAG: hypothetical protein ACFBSF_19480 [Leptolyngbyaceae cyanobacterium]
MKSTRWMMLILVMSVSLLGVACGGPEAETEPAEPVEEVEEPIEEEVEEPEVEEPEAE